MAVDTRKLFYLLDPVFQIENLAGKPVVGGHIEVFVAGTDTKYITWQDWDGARNPFKIPLNSDGRAVILVEPQYTYDIYVYDSFNNLVCSRLNVAPSIGGDVTIPGLTQVFHDETLSGDGTPYGPLGVVSAGKVYEGVDPIVVNNDEDKISANNVPIGVQEPLYFVQDDEEGCILGCSGDTEPYVNHDRTIKIDNHVISTDMQAVMIRQQINNSSNEYKYAKICEADLNTITWINEWMTTLQLNFQSCGPYYEGKSFGTFVLNCENYIQSSQTYVQKHEEDGKWVIFAKDDQSPQIVKLYLYWRDDSSSQHYELWGEFANLKYYEAVGVAAILNCSLRNHLTSSLPIDQERNIWRFNPIGIETLKNALPTGMNLVGQYLPEDASIKPVSDDSAGTFYATYVYNGPASGNTSFDDIKAAYEAGKSVYVNYKENSDSKDTLIFSLVLFRDTPIGRPDLSCFFFTNIDRGTEKCIYRFPSNWGKMSDRNLADADSLWTLEQSIAPDDFLVPIPSPSGVYCTRNYKVYKALEPITSNTWVDSAWTQVKVMDEIYNLQNKEENHNLFVAEYPTTDATAVQSALSAGKYVVTKLGNDFIPVVYTDEYHAGFCGFVGGNSAGAGGYSIDVNFSTGWSDPIYISFATYPGVHDMISAATSGALSSVYQPYAGTGTTGNLVFSAERYPKQVRACISGTSATVTAGVLPPVPEQNSTSTQILVAASGSLADVEWREFDVSGLTGKLDNSASGNFYPMTGNPSGFLTTPDLSSYATEQWVNDQSYMHEYMASAFYSADNPSGFITNDDITGKQDNLTFGYNDTSISAIDTSALYDNSAHARIGTLSTRISNLDSGKQDKLTFHYVEI